MAGAGRCVSPSHKMRSAPSIACCARVDADPLDRIRGLVPQTRRCRSGHRRRRPGRPALRSGRASCPAIGDTIAASRSASALSRVDLPLLGGPAMTIRNPSRNRSDRRIGEQSRRSRPPAAATAAAIAATASRATSSSSAKSSCASTRAAKASTRSVQPSITCAQRPFRHRQRGAPLALGLGGEQVAQPFRLGQIDPPGHQRAPGELARLGAAQPRHAPPSAASTARTTARPP